MAVADKVKSIIVEQLGVDEEEVTPDASFVDDLGADSLDTVELVMAFEEEFGIEIPDEDAEKITRVKEAVEYIESHGKKEIRHDRDGWSSQASGWCRRWASAPSRTGTALCHGLQRHRAHHEVRHDGFLGAHRGRGQELRSAALHREKRRQEDGHLHPVRHRGVAVRGRGREAGCHAGDRAARRGVHRVGDRRVHHDRARAQGAARRRPPQDLAVLHSLGHHQPGRRPGVDSPRRERAQFRHLHGVLRLGACHRRRLRDHPARTPRT